MTSLRRGFYFWLRLQSTDKPCNLCLRSTPAMEVKELFTPSEKSVTEQDRIPAEVLRGHIEAIEEAYSQAGLDPNDSSLRRCPGSKTNNDKFQVNLSRMPSGELIGIHTLALTTEEDHINETYIFLWEEEIESSVGVLKSPTSLYVTDYSLDATTIQRLTDYIRETTQSGGFEAVDEMQRLSLPQ